MKKLHQELSARYLAALRGHVTRKIGDNGDRAQGLGRAALAQGLVVRDLAVMHTLAVEAIGNSPIFLRRPKDAIKRAGYFFTQALMPLESAQRHLRTQSRQVARRQRTLQRHTKSLARGSRQLVQEVARGRQKETLIHDGHVRYRKLLRESQIMQRKLRELTRQIISAQEEERKEISRELHDGVVQLLVGINVQLAALSHHASIGAAALPDKIRRTQRLVVKSVNAVHRFARELRPAVLDDLGLIPALQAYCENVAEREKMLIRITAFGGVEGLGEAKRTVLFRVAQEALTNVVRHANATQVHLSIGAIPGGIRMEIADNGTSFPVENALARRGRKRLGLIGMRERMEMVGGSLVLQSRPDEGTTVRAEMPFNRPKSAL